MTKTNSDSKYSPTGRLPSKPNTPYQYPRLKHRRPLVDDKLLEGTDFAKLEREFLDLMPESTKRLLKVSKQ